MEGWALAGRRRRLRIVESVGGGWTGARSWCCGVWNGVPGSERAGRGVMTEDRRRRSAGAKRGVGGARRSERCPGGLLTTGERPGGGPGLVSSAQAEVKDGWAGREGDFHIEDQEDVAEGSSRVCARLR